MELLVAGRYKRGRKISTDSDAYVYEGEDMESKEKVALKFESVDCDYPTLKHERELYEILGGGHGIANIRWFGYAAMSSSNVLVMDLLGRSLQHLLECCGNKFSLKTVLMLADQLIERLQYVHSKGLVYHSVKPDSFVKGLRGEQAPQVYIVDFGFAKQFRDPATGAHVPYSCGGLYTSPRDFMSVNCHSRILTSRRDDMESLGYMLIHFLRGNLPWQRRSTTAAKGRMKAVMSAAEICQGFPSEFESYLQYCRALDFQETPDYDSLRSKFRHLFSEEGFELDYIYDWDLQRSPPPRRQAVTFS